MADKEPSDTVLLNGAKSRATITAWLSQNPGEHPVKDIATATGKISSTTGQILAHMAKEKLIFVRKNGTSKLYRLEKDASPGATEPGPSPRAIRLAAKEAKEAKKTGAKAHGREVELKISGFVVILGRNPDTGRLRITLDEQG